MNSIRENSTGRNDEEITEGAIAAPRLSAMQVIGSTLAAVLLICSSEAFTGSAPKRVYHDSGAGYN